VTGFEGQPLEVSRDRGGKDHWDLSRRPDLLDSCQQGKRFSFPNAGRVWEARLLEKNNSSQKNLSIPSFLEKVNIYLDD